MDRDFIDETNKTVAEILDSDKNIRELLLDTTSDHYYHMRMEIDEYTVFVHFKVDCLQSLEEARYPGIHIGGTYSALFHNPHVPGQQKHIHIFDRGDQLLVMNHDGSGSHGFSGSRLPNKVTKGLKSLRKGIVIPDDGILESCPLAVEFLVRNQNLPLSETTDKTNSSPS